VGGIPRCRRVRAAAQNENFGNTAAEAAAAGTRDRNGKLRCCGPAGGGGKDRSHEEGALVKALDELLQMKHYESDWGARR